MTPARVAEVTTPAIRAEALHLTGERTVPGIAEENYWFRRHEAAYTALLPHCADATVLEAGCGEGYGAGLLATTARRVLALDYDVPTTEFERLFDGPDPVDVPAERFESARAQLSGLRSDELRQAFLARGYTTGSAEWS